MMEHILRKLILLFVSVFLRKGSRTEVEGSEYRQSLPNFDARLDHAEKDTDNS